MADLHVVLAHGEQALGGERLDHRVHVRRGSARVQLRPRGPARRDNQVAAGSDQLHEERRDEEALAARQTGVGVVGAGGDAALESAGPLVVGQGQGVFRAASPGLVESVGQVGEAARVRRCACQLVRQRGLHVRARHPGGLADGQPQLPPRHRAEQVPVLDRVRQLLVRGAVHLEVCAEDQQHHGGGLLAGALPGRRSRVQGGDEGAALGLVRALGEDLLELIDDDEQSARGVRAGADGGLADGDREPP